MIIDAATEDTLDKIHLVRIIIEKLVEDTKLYWETRNLDDYHRVKLLHELENLDKPLIELSRRINDENFNAWLKK